MSANINNSTSQAFVRTTSESVWDLSTFTIEAYIKLNTALAAQTIWNRGTDDGAQESMRFNITTAGKLDCLIFNTAGANTRIVCNTVLSTGVWTRVAMSWDGTNITGYVSQASDGTAAGAKTIDTTTSKKTGMGMFQATTPNQPLRGKLSDLRFYNFVRTTTQMNADYNLRLGGGETGLIGYWKLDEASGNTATDSTANGRNFTATTGTWDTTDNPVFLPRGGAALFGL